jgi:hypothetical protein
LHPVIISVSPAPIPESLPGVPPSSTTISMGTGTGLPHYPNPMIRSEPAAEHDATVLLAALEDIESRRQALEWLLEADLLGQCLV